MEMSNRQLAGLNRRRASYGDWGVICREIIEPVGVDVIIKKKRLEREKKRGSMAEPQIIPLGGRTWMMILQRLRD